MKNNIARVLLILIAWFSLPNLLPVAAQPEPPHYTRWSPDGTHIAFGKSLTGFSVDFDIYVVAADGTHLRNVTGNSDSFGSHFAWIDNTHLLVDSHITSQRGKAIVSIDSFERVELDNFGEISARNISPDRSRIAYIGGDTSGALFVINSDGSERIQYTDDGAFDTRSDINWLPDGQRVAVEAYDPSGECSLLLIDVGGDQAGNVTEIPDCGISGRIEISPDGQYIAMTVSREEVEYPVIVDVADGTEITLADLPGAHFDHARSLAFSSWSADSAYLALAQTGEDTRNIYYVYDLANEKLINLGELIEGDFHFYNFAMWSPDEQRLLLSGEFRSPPLLSVEYVYDAEAQTLAKLVESEEPGTFFVPCGDAPWSPNGARVLVEYHGAGTARNDLYVARANGRTIFRFSGAVGRCKWSPNSDLFVYLGYYGTGGRLYIGTTSSGEAYPLVPSAVRGVAEYDWSPDGSAMFLNDVTGLSVFTVSEYRAQRVFIITPQVLAALNAAETTGVPATATSIPATATVTEAPPTETEAVSTEVPAIATEAPATMTATATKAGATATATEAPATATATATVTATVTATATVTVTEAAATATATATNAGG